MVESCRMDEYLLIDDGTNVDDRPRLTYSDQTGHGLKRSDFFMISSDATKK